MTELHIGLRDSAETWRCAAAAGSDTLIHLELARPRTGSRPGAVGTCVSGGRVSTSRRRADQSAVCRSRTGRRSGRSSTGWSGLAGRRGRAARAPCTGGAVGLVVPAAGRAGRPRVGAGDPGGDHEWAALAVAGVIVVQALMTFLALRMSVLFGQDVLAEAREYVVHRARPAAGPGRGRAPATWVTRDVSTMSQSVRFGLPESVIAGMSALLTVVAMLINSPLLALLVVAPIFLVAVRRYLKQAPMGYITEGGTYSMINSTLTETVEGAHGRGARAAGQPGEGERHRHRPLGTEALHHGAAEHLVHAARLRLRHPGDHGAEPGRGGLSQRLGDPGPDHGGGALRRRWSNRWRG